MPPLPPRQCSIRSHVIDALRRTQHALGRMRASISVPLGTQAAQLAAPLAILMVRVRSARKVEHGYLAPGVSINGEAREEQVMQGSSYSPQRICALRARCIHQHLVRPHRIHVARLDQLQDDGAPAQCCACGMCCSVLMRASVSLGNQGASRAEPKALLVCSRFVHTWRVRRCCCCS